MTGAALKLGDYALRKYQFRLSEKRCPRYGREEDMLGMILLLIVVLLLLGALPTWPYSTNWGYYPSGGLGLLLVIVIVLLVVRR